MENIKSGLFRLSRNDLVRGACTAMFAAAAFGAWNVIAPVIQTPGFDVFSVDWAQTLSQALSISINAAITALTGYIGMKFFSNKDGKIFGKIG